MSRPVVIVTGLIGSGKSAVCALLRERGLPVYDCDLRAKELYNRRPALLPALETALGMPLRGKDGQLDRAVLAGRIFSDDAARETVEALLYPELLKDIKRWRSRQKGAPFVVIESAVILTKPVFDGLADAVVAVTAPEELRMKRVMQRDASSEDQVLRRMAAQVLPLDKADVVIENSGSPEALKTAVQHTFFDKNSYLCKMLNTEIQA